MSKSLLFGGVKFDARMYKQKILKDAEKGLYHESQVRRMKQMPTNLLPKYMKALKGNSRACAIASQCMECVCWDNYAYEIRNCSDEGCPLYEYRPYKETENE